MAQLSDLAKNDLFFQVTGLRLENYHMNENITTDKIEIHKLIDNITYIYEEKLKWIPVEEKEPECFENEEDGIYYSKYLELKVNGYEYPLIGYYVYANDDQFFDIISEKDDDIKQEDITHFRECFL